MIRLIDTRLLLLTAIVMIMSGCSVHEPGAINESVVTGIDESADYPPKFQSRQYLAAREKLIKNLVPEERLPAVQILDMMVELMAKDRCKPEEILVNFSDVSASEYIEKAFTAVSLDMPAGLELDCIVMARPFQIQENHVTWVCFNVDAYLSCGCCTDTENTRYPEEDNVELWNLVGKFPRLEGLDIGGWGGKRYSPMENAARVQDFRKN